MHSANAIDPEGDTAMNRSVLKAIAVLDELANSGSEMSAADLASAIGHDRTVIHRLLRTLMIEQFVVQHGRGRYSLGPHTLLVGNSYLDHLRLQAVALPFLSDLATRFQDEPWVITVSLPARRFAILADRLWSPTVPLDSMLAIGTRLPIARSAQGRVMLAYSDLEKLHDLLQSAPSRELSRRLEKIRRAHGFEVSNGELAPGICAIAQVIRGANSPIGAIAISGPDLDPHLSKHSVPALHLRRAADRIEQSL